LFGFSLLLLAASIGLYFAGDFGWIYLGTAIAAGVVIVVASLRLMLTGASSDAWQLYKLSAFPYLGIVFLAMAVDILFL
jgi:protoheme IX farnesyltransferase